MVVERNSTPWVVLVIIVMAGCAISGMLLANVGPFNSHVVEAKIPVQQTQGALDSIATQEVMSIAQTQQAPVLEGTAVAAQMTLLPLQQAATQAALQSIATQTAAVNNLQNAQIMAQATQTTVANELLLQGQAVAATATSIANAQSQRGASGASGNLLPALGLLLTVGWIGTRATVLITKARAQEKAASAKLLAEARRAATQQANIETQMLRQRQINQSSLIRQRNNNKDLPRAE